ncbi:uncharacterized protein LOC135826575 [Sycon ciliatum]|uniref:uncharacterized protein LOC135826575 n=1 Tax=Sycon ciliatum TaxID=27933 RepID=UPI0031F6F2B5
MPLIDYSYPNDSYKQGSVTPKQAFGKPCFDLYVEEDDTDSRSAGDSTGEANVCSAGRITHPTECGRDAGSKSPVSDLEVISPPEDTILDVNGLIESIKTEIVGTVKAELAALQEVFSGISSAIVNMQGELSMIRKEQADLAHTHTPISTVQSDSRISALEDKCKEQEARLKSVEHNMQHMYTEPTPLKKAGDTVSKPGARGLQMQQANQGRLKIPITELGVECVSVRLRLCTKPKAIELAVCSIYRPPSATVDFWNLCSQHLDVISRKFSRIIVLGDFNTDVLQQSSNNHHYKHLSNLCEEFHLRNVVTSPTRLAKTCLDLILVYAAAPHVKTTVVSVDGVSDHDLVLTNFSYKATQQANSRLKFVRKPLPHAIDPATLCDDIDSTLEPLPKKVRTHPSDQQLLQRYRAIRREGTLLNRQLKSQYYIREFKNRRHDPRGQWAIINSLSGRTAVRAAPAATLADLTTTFAEIVHDPARPVELPLPVADPNSTTLLEFDTVSVDTISKLLESLVSNKATGSDDIPSCILKSCRDSVSYPLTVIVNQSLRSGIFPAAYKHAHVCPVYKSGDKTSATNYRPILLLPIAAKILEKVVHKQVTSYFTQNPDLSAIPAEQFAYRSPHSCEDALTLCIDRWNRALDNGDQCGVVFADMSKAFDRVQHTGLLGELATTGLGGTVLKWFSDYLTNRSQQVTVNGEKGDTKPCTRGVPQGSVLGPLLFCVYIRRVPDIFHQCVVQLYADDIAFYVFGSDVATIMLRLQDSMRLLEQYLDEKGLLLNPTKT